MQFSKMPQLIPSSCPLTDEWKAEVDKLWKEEKKSWKKLPEQAKYDKFEAFKEKLLEIAFTPAEKKFVSESYTHEEIWPGKFCDPVANCSGGISFTMIYCR